MERRVYVLAALWIIIIPHSLIIECYAWGNGGYSSSPSTPKYGTHDWIAEHALDWLPSEAKYWIIANLNWYLYGTELPDNGQAPDGIGDTSLHHIYFNANGILVDDAAARRANATFNQALTFMLLGDFASAAKYAGAMTHYIADMAVFGHVMGSGTDWGTEVHHSDYEEYVGKKTSSYSSEWSVYLSFDGELRFITAYNAAVELAYDTTFDRSGRGLTCVWMDRNYNWSNPIFVARALESLNLAVNYITDVLYTLYMAYTAQTTKQTVATITFSITGISSNASGAVLMVDGVPYTHNQLPITFMWEVGSTHEYAWTEIVESTFEDTRFRLAFVTGLSNKSLGPITVPPEGGSIEAVYKTQYRVGIGAEADKGTTEPPPGIYWFDAGTYLNVTAIPGPRYEFKMWRAVTAAGATYDRDRNPTTIWLGGPINIVAEFTEAFDYRITLIPNSISVYRGRTANLSVQVERTSGEAREKIRLSLASIPSGVSYRFSVESDYPPLIVTLTITTSKDAPIGTHILTVRALYGEVVKETPLSVTIMEPERAWYEQPWILATAALMVIVAITIIFWRRRA